MLILTMIRHLDKDVSTVWRSHCFLYSHWDKWAILHLNHMMEVETNKSTVWESFKEAPYSTLWTAWTTALTHCSWVRAVMLCYNCLTTYPMYKHTTQWMLLSLIPRYNSEIKVNEPLQLLMCTLNTTCIKANLQHGALL